MKGDIKEIVLKITPQTSFDELISYCDSVEDFDELFREYLKLQGEEDCDANLSELILAEYKRMQEGIRLSLEIMEKYHKKDDERIN